MKQFWVVAVAVLIAVFVGCSSSSTGGKTPSNPTTPVTLTISASPPQTQTVQVPQQSGPATGTVTFPPVTTVPANTSGDLTLNFLSGTNVAFQRAVPSQAQSFARERNSTASLPGGPYIFEMTVTAPFAFTLASVPAFQLNLGTLDTAGPSAAYVLVVEDGTSATYQFPTTAQGGVISFPGSVPSLTVAAGDILTFGIALAVNVPAAPTITSFTATPSTFADGGGGTVTLAWDVTGATTLSIDNAVGAVTPVTTGSVTPSVTATTTFTLEATNANGTTVATASVCVAGAITAVVTSPTSYTQCTDSFLTSIVMTNGSCQVVTVSVVGFVSTAGTCGFNGPGDYTSADDSNLPFSVDSGATATVFDLTNGGIGCCAVQPCSINCTDTLEWTLTTNAGPISAAALPFSIDVAGCNLPCPP